MLLQQEKLKRQQEKLKQYSQEQIEENKKKIEELSWQLENAVKDKDLLHRNLLLVQKNRLRKTIGELKRCKKCSGRLKLVYI